jgi:outer membrane protein assembly factor BamB
LNLSLSAFPQNTDWPQFLGPARNGTYAGHDLAASWPTEGPSTLWQTNVGQGFSGPAAQDGKLIIFHRLEDRETVDCLDATNGSPIWRFAYPTGYHDDYGFDEGPRATPTLNGGRVYTFGAEGALHCLDITNGAKLWSVQTKDQFHAPKGFFGLACSPLVQDGKVVLNIGAPDDSGIVAFDQVTGKLLWHATATEASYSSPISGNLGGRSSVICFTRNGLAALNVTDGKVQFEFPWRSRNQLSVNAATPLLIGDLVFLSASYGTGAVLLDCHKGRPEKVWSSDDALSSHYATSVHREGFLYGFHGRQEYGPSLRCVELRTGKVQWSRDHFGAGTPILADDRLVVLKESGELLLISASPKSYQELARAQVLGQSVRAYPALSDGFLFARSKDKLVCLDLRKHL